MVILASGFVSESEADSRDIKASYRQVKAAFTFNFSLFTDWPETAFESPESPITIGVLDEKEFADALISVIGNRTVKGRRFEVKSSDSINNLKDSHIIFINSRTKNLDEVLEGIKTSSILTIGDSPGFAQRGVVINFFIESDKVRFEVNLDAANEAKLTISSRVLQLAKIIRSAKGNAND